MGILDGDIGCGGLFVSAVAAGLVFLGGCAVTNQWHVGDGERVGMVNKLSKKGYFWKTYEGQMALEGIVSDGKSVGANVWDFAVDRYWDSKKVEAMATQVRDSMEKGVKVRVKYTEFACTFPWRSGSSYLIQSIEPLNAVKSQKTSPQTERYNSGGSSQAVSVDGRFYSLKHGPNGNLIVRELVETQ